MKVYVPPIELQYILPLTRLCPKEKVRYAATLHYKQTEVNFIV